MELAARSSRNRSAVDTRSIHRDLASVVDLASRQALARDSGERITQINLARSFDGHRLEAGVESAINTLDARTNSWRDEGAGWSPANLPNANLRVREERRETFAGYLWQPRTAWSMEARLTAESSRLDLGGDTHRTIDLVYWKPSLQLGRTFGERNQLQLRMFRDVGQLDFNDFVSSISLADDVVNGGNPALRPETSWRTEVAADLRLGEESALSIKGYHYRVADAVDLVSIGDPAAPAVATANIGDATITGIDLSCSVPLRAVLPGGVFGLAATLQDSDVSDPITRVARALSDFQPALFKAGFRQDLTERRVAWGINYARYAATRRFSPAEDDTHRGGPALDVFLETIAIDSFKVRLSAYSVLGSPELRERVFYSPDRAGAIASVESSERRPGSWWMLSLSGNL
jgi:hypothetical protein